MRCSRAILLLAFTGAIGSTSAAETKFRSHPPMRPLPVPSQRAMGKGPATFVDPLKGADANDGSEKAPWKTLGHALRGLKPGDTLYLRGGTYYESATIALTGTAEKPITVRAYPGELAVLDSGLREFFEAPATAWEPFTGGAPDEYRSVKPYPGRKQAARRDVLIAGHFGDSMVPLHGYRFLPDFRTTNEYWNLGDKGDAKEGVYLGPGLWYDVDTSRIHVRLSHLKAKGYGDDRYTGETDPRKLPLVVAGTAPALRIENAKHLIVQDLICRGSTGGTVQVAGAENLVLDNVTIYGGSPALSINGARRLRLMNSALRGRSAPWSSRASNKYRSQSPYLLTCGRDNRDFEFANNEFTDNHDGLTIGTVLGMDFHHNLVEGFDDDGVYLNAMAVGGDIRIYQNRFARILSTFSYSGNAKPGKGVWICRNVFDMRRPIYGAPPTGPDDKEAGPRPGRVWGDHGSPTWEPMNIYHNTVILPGAEFRGYYAAGWGGHTHGNPRRIFNNLIVHLEEMPGLNFSSADDDVQADGNLHWSVKQGPTVKGDFFAAFRKSKLFEASKKRSPDGWAAHDLFADPKFVQFAADWKQRLDLRLQKDSPAVDAGVPIPEKWFDPLRGQDQGKPDIGALPLGAEPFMVGRRKTTTEK